MLCLNIFNWDNGYITHLLGLKTEVGHAVVVRQILYPRDVDQIGNHGGGSFLGARTGTVDHRHPSRIAFDHHGVHGVVNVREQVIGGNERGVNTQFKGLPLHTLRQPFPNSQQFDAVGVVSENGK